MSEKALHAIFGQIKVITMWGFFRTLLLGAILITLWLK